MAWSTWTPQRRKYIVCIYLYMIRLCTQDGVDMVMAFVARHFRKLQEEGVRVWDGRLNKMRTVRVALLFSSNDIRA